MPSFDLSNRKSIDDISHKDIYRMNLARNMALLTGDSAVIRRFYRQGAESVAGKDIFASQEIRRSFFANQLQTNAFVYSGLIPWAVESIVRLVASSGFTVNSLPNDNDEASQDLRDYINYTIDKIDLKSKFARGVYLESGLGDFAYRISYDENISNDPILEIIEPQYIDVEYYRGILKKITIKDTSDVEVVNKKAYDTIELREIYSKKINESGKRYVEINYEFWKKNKKISENDLLFSKCMLHWELSDTKIEFPFDWFPVIFKKNNKKSELYKQERGVPDIQGIDTLEDALSECLSNMVDAIRKGAPKTFVNEDLLPADIRGKTFEHNTFKHEYKIVSDSNIDPSKLYTVLQARIDWQSYVEISKIIISNAINRMGMAPSTLGVTGLESINSSAESQDAREKPSLRTREEKLETWKSTLQDILNKYFQYKAWILGETIEDYSDMIDISFNEYISPSTENIINVLAGAIRGNVMSIESAIEKRFEHENKKYELDDIIIEAARIRNITPNEEINLLGILPDLPADNADNHNESTETLNEEN